MDPSMILGLRSQRALGACNLDKVGKRMVFECHCDRCHGYHSEPQYTDLRFSAAQIQVVAKS